MAKVTGYTTIAGLQAALRRLPKEASAKLRDASGDIASSVADKAASRARATPGAAHLVAGSIKARRDRVPVIQMGGNTPLPASGSTWSRSRSGGRQTIGDVIWGAEYGGGARASTRQFSPWRGSGDGAGYFLWPTVRDENQEIADAYSEALLEALEAI